MISKRNSIIKKRSIVQMLLGRLITVFRDNKTAELKTIYLDIDKESD